MAGDVSGDINTAKLARLLLERHPGWTLHAVGGAHLGAEAARSPGGSWIGDTSELSGIGIYSSIKMVPRAKILEMRLRRFVREHKIDAAVPCDWGRSIAINSRFEKGQSRCCIISRRVRGGGRAAAGWGSRRWRTVSRRRSSGRRSACGRRGASAEWVGHPMLETKFRGREARAAARGIRRGGKRKTGRVAARLAYFGNQHARAADCGGSRYFTRARRNAFRGRRAATPGGCGEAAFARLGENSPGALGGRSFLRATPPS